MTDLFEQLRGYGEQLLSELDRAEVEASTERSPRVQEFALAPEDPAEVAETGADVCESCGADLTVFDLRVPDESPAPRPRKRRAAVLAVAAAILLVAGVVVVPDRNDNGVETEPVSSATRPDPVPSPTSPGATPPPEEAGLPLSVVDSLGYRWSQVPYDEAAFGGRQSWINEVAVGGPGLVAVGGDDEVGGSAAVWTSVDGLTWSRVPHDEAVFGGDGETRINEVAVGGPGLVAVGGDYEIGDSEERRAAVWTSVDGLTWSRVPHDEAVFGGGMINEVAVGGPGLVAVGGAGGLDGGSAAVWTSVDGLTWSRVPHDEAVFGGEPNQWMGMASVTAGGPGFVAVGGEFVGQWTGGTEDDLDAAVWTSVDGLTWSRVPHDEAVFGGESNQGMARVIEGGPGLVVVGGDYEIGDLVGGSGSAAVWTSVDGLTWSRVPHDEAVFGAALEPAHGAAAMLDITASGSGLAAVGLAGVWTSADGLTWSHQHLGEFVFNVAAGGSPNLPAIVALGERAAWVATPEN